MRLPLGFYRRTDVVAVARDLLGMILATHLPLNGTGGSLVHTAVRITEVEAYAGPEDRASHAYANRRTRRTEVMFAPGGVAYVYLCYGMHHLFNVVTGERDVPHAVLIRSGEPVQGLESMQRRRGGGPATPNLTSGPGRLAAALGIQTAHSGVSLCGSRIRIEDRGPDFHPRHIKATPRIGVGYAAEDAQRPWRFIEGDSSWTTPAVSREIAEQGK